MVNGTAGHSPWNFECEQGLLLLRNYETYTQQVARCLRSRYPGLAASAEDLAQEAFLRTAQACRQGRLETGRGPFPYLLKTAQRLAIDVLRGEVEEPVEAGRLGKLRERQRDGHDGGVTGSVDLREVVTPAIAGMRPTQRRRVLELQNAGMEDEAIAAQLDVPRGQVSVQRTRGVAELQSMDEVRSYIRPGHRKGRRSGGGRRGE
ncbi:sigma-70 family RNA polymerase sigma factor [Streptomyces sp. 549]|uniref:RNA polymerase sigma factor n=1 Tax=Streptomyces sp. 549 TaxID=3049076 RepID=UPI0024C446A5|nr:sigma-70 family RNA polymerase sigma factor [Streptomyces sp. 549]MDK1476841.1 sigma-70 family RNA polymerase sigma factor [Streptomyces sp. 549]